MTRLKYPCKLDLLSGINSFAGPGISGEILIIFIVFLLGIYYVNNFLLDGDDARWAMLTMNENCKHGPMHIVYVRVFLGFLHLQHTTHLHINCLRKHIYMHNHAASSCMREEQYTS